MPNPDELLTIAEAAEVACVAENAMRRAVSTGRVPSTIETRGRYKMVARIRRADAEAFTYLKPAMEAVRQSRLAERGPHPRAQ